MSLVCEEVSLYKLSFVTLIILNVGDTDVIMSVTECHCRSAGVA